MHPIAVLIDYQDWQKIEQLLESYYSQAQQEENALSQFAGSIQLTEDPLQYQQRVRSEW